MLKKIATYYDHLTKPDFLFQNLTITVDKIVKVSNRLKCRSELNGISFFFIFSSFLHCSWLANHTKINKYIEYKMHMVNNNMESHIQHGF